MLPLGLALFVTLVAIALRGSRWAELSLRVSRWSYAAFVLFSILYFPYKTGFQLVPPVCEWTFGFELALHSLTNFPHIIMFALFFLLTYAQFPNAPRALVWSALACVAMGLVVELMQGMTGRGHCRMRDLIPDSTGALIGALIVVIGSRASDRRSH